MSGNMTKIAVLDDWQGIARVSADWSALESKAQVTIFQEAFADENDAAAKLADFDIVLSMRERTPLPGSLINRLPKLRMRCSASTTASSPVGSAEGVCSRRCGSVTTLLSAGAVSRRRSLAGRWLRRLSPDVPRML